MGEITPTAMLNYIIKSSWPIDAAQAALDVADQPINFSGVGALLTPDIAQPEEDNMRSPLLEGKAF